jgi:hypothetical protein
MININILFEDSAQSKYCVYFGNGCRYDFTDAKKYKKFCSDTNENYILWTLVVTEIHLEMFADFRRNIIFLKSNNQSVNTFNKDFQLLTYRFTAIVESIDFVFLSSNLKNHIVYSKIENCVHWLELTHKILSEYHIKKANTSSVFAYKSLKIRLDILRKDIEKFITPSI